MSELLLTSLLAGLSSAALIVLLRAAPFIRTWTQQGTKPWACDVCMSLWTTLAVMAFLWRHLDASWLSWLPAYAVAKWTVGRLMDPTHFPSFDLSVKEDELEEPSAPEASVPINVDVSSDFATAEPQMSQRPTRPVQMPALKDSTMTSFVLPPKKKDK